MVLIATAILPSTGIDLKAMSAKAEMSPRKAYAKVYWSKQLTWLETILEVLILYCFSWLWSL